MKKVLQKEYIRNILIERGFVTRNFALSKHISRLSGIIYQLKDDGMNIRGKRYPLRGRTTWSGLPAYDYVYILEVDNDK